MNIPRSHAISRMLKQYLHHRQAQQLLEQINRAYAPDPDGLESDLALYEAAEQQQLQMASRSFRRLLAEAL